MGEPAGLRSVAQPHCPACGHRGAPALRSVADYYGGSPGAWDLSACPGCASLYLDPAPAPEDLGLAYRDYHTHGQRPRKSWRTHWRSLYARLLVGRLRRLDAWRPLERHHQERRHMHLDDLPPGRLLDVGCGNGKFLERMRGRGWDVAGIDFDADATRVARERRGLRVYTGDLREAALQEAPFDAIVMNHAVEHVPDPVGLLRRCAQLLRPGGRLVVITPNALSVGRRRFGRYWRGLEAPRHLQVFTRAGLAVAVQAAGLEVLRAETFSCDAEIVYRTSREMARRARSAPLDPLEATRRSWLDTLAEQRALRRNPDCGEDVLVIARRPPA